MLNTGQLTNGSTPNSSRPTLGSLFKRLTPASRARSKSPMFHIVGRNDQVNKDKANKSSPWVTVEVKQQTSPPSKSSAKTRRSRDVMTDGDATSKSTTLPPFGAMSISMVDTIDFDPNTSQPHAGSSNQSIASASRNKSSTIGNFLRHSLRRPKKHTVAQTPTDAGDGAVVQPSAITAPSAITTLPPMSSAGRQRTGGGGGGRFSAKQKFDDFFAALTAAASPRRRRRGGGGGVGAVAVSEENLVSKVLHAEKSICIDRSDDGDSLKLKTDESLGHLPAALLSTPAPFFYSQHNVFDDGDASSSPSSAVRRVPSYVRLSCTLSGYKNYRAVDLASATKVKLSLPPRHLTLDVDALDDDGRTSTPASFERATYVDVDGGDAAGQTPRLPLGKSIVERRLEIFDSPPPSTYSASRNADHFTLPPKPSSRAEKRPIDSGSSPANSFPASDSSPPVPIKDLITNFNRMTPPTIPPKPRSAVKAYCSPDPRCKVDPAINTEMTNQPNNAEFSSSGPSTDSTLDNERNIAARYLSHSRYCNSDKIDLNGAEVAPADKNTKIDNLSQKIDVAIAHGEITTVRAYCSSEVAPPTVANSRAGGNEAQSVDVADSRLDYNVERDTKANYGNNSNNTTTRALNGLNCTDRCFELVEEDVATAEAKKGSSSKIDISRASLCTQFDDVTKLARCQMSYANGTRSDQAISSLCRTVSARTVNETSKHHHDVMDGRFYKSLAEKERRRLDNLAKEAEDELNNDQLPEHAAEEIRTGIGKVKLLLRKKFAMFESLIDKNINPIPNDPCPTFDSDLEGYWQLVKLELADIDSNFDRIGQMRRNDWQKINEAESPPIMNGKRTSAKSSLRALKKGSCSTNSLNSNAAKFREESRKKLNEAKLAGLERKKLQNVTASDGFIAI